MPLWKSCLGHLLTLAVLIALIVTPCIVCSYVFDHPPRGRRSPAERAAADIERTAPLVPEHEDAMWQVTNEWTRRLRDAGLDVTVEDIAYDVRIAVASTEHRVSYRKAADLYGETLLESRDKETAALAVFAAARAGRLR